MDRKRKILARWTSGGEETTPPPAVESPTEASKGEPAPPLDSNSNSTLLTASKVKAETDVPSVPPPSTAASRRARKKNKWGPNRSTPRKRQKVEHATPTSSSKTISKTMPAAASASKGSSASASAASSERATLGTPHIKDKRTVLLHQNRELSTLVARLKAERSALREDVSRLKKREAQVESTISCATRTWDQLIKDTTSLLVSSGVVSGEDAVVAACADVAKACADNNMEIDDDDSSSRTRIERINYLLSSGISNLSGNSAVVLKKDQVKGDDEEDEDDDDVDALSGKAAAAIESVLQKRVVSISGAFGALVNALANRKGDNGGGIKATALEQVNEELRSSVKNAETLVGLLKHKLASAAATVASQRSKLEDATHQNQLLERRHALVVEQVEAHIARENAIAVKNAADGGGDDDAGGISGASSAEVKKLKQDLEDARKQVVVRVEEIERLSKGSAKLFEELKDLGNSVVLGSGTGEILKLKTEVARLHAAAQEAKASQKAAANAADAKEKTIASLKSHLEALEKSTSSKLSDMRAKYEEQVDDLKERLVGADVSVQATRNEMEELRRTVKTAGELTTLLAAAKSRIKALEGQVESMKSSGERDEDALIGEIESLSATLGDLQEQNERLVEQVSEKESRIATSMQSQVKLRREISVLKTAGTSGVVPAHQDGELDRLRSSNQTLEAQVAKCKDLLSAMDKKLQRVSTTAFDAFSAKLEALTSDCEAWKKKCSDDAERYNRTIDAVAANVKRDSQSRIEAQDAATELKREVDKLSRAVTRKGGAIDRSSSGDNLRLELMQRALRCSVNPTLWKDCILTRCNHMFSRDAIDELYAARNRKCPQCKTGFTRDEIKSIYLYQRN